MMEIQSYGQSIKGIIEQFNRQDNIFSTTTAVSNAVWQCVITTNTIASKMGEVSNMLYGGGITADKALRQNEMLKTLVSCRIAECEGQVNNAKQRIHAKNHSLQDIPDFSKRVLASDRMGVRDKARYLNQLATEQIQHGYILNQCKSQIKMTHEKIEIYQQHLQHLNRAKMDLQK